MPQRFDGRAGLIADPLPKASKYNKLAPPDHRISTQK